MGSLSQEGHGLTLRRASHSGHVWVLLQPCQVWSRSWVVPGVTQLMGRARKGTVRRAQCHSCHGQAGPSTSHAVSATPTVLWDVTRRGVHLPRAPLKKACLVVNSESHCESDLHFPVDLLLFSRPVQLFGTHGLQHASLPCPSPTGVRPNSCPLSWCCHPAISSSVIPFSSCPQSFPASGSVPMSQFLASGGQSIGASASASVLPMKIQD